MKRVKKGVSGLIVVVGILCIFATVVTFTSRDQWWMRVFDYPRLQIAIISVVILFLTAFVMDRRKRRWQVYSIILLIIVAWNGYLLHPYLLPITPQVTEQRITNPERIISLLIANVLMENRESDSFLDIIEEHDPDVILVMETNAWWIEQLAPLREKYVYHVEQPQDNHYGIALYSRFALSNTDIRRFESNDTPSIQTTITLASGDKIGFYGLHPRPPLPENSVSLADKELIKVAEEVKGADRPIIAAGDFNDVPWSYTLEKFQEISQLRDLRVGRGFYNTFDAKNLFLKLPLDHVFVTPHLGLVEIANPVAFSSDHKALFVELVVIPDGQNE